MNFNKSGTLNYKQIQLDFVYQDNGSIDLASVINRLSTFVASEINTIDDLGTLIGYQLTLTGDGTETPFIPQVFLTIPAVYEDVIMTESTILDNSNIEAFVENEQLNENNSENFDGIIGWSVEREVGIKLNNSFAKWVGIGGSNFACRFSRALALIDPDTQEMQQLSDYIPFMTGWVGSDTSLIRQDPIQRFDITLHDKSWQLKNTQCGIERYQDGMCYQAAMRYQLLMAGVNEKYISQDPYMGFGTCSLTANPEGCNHFKLPIGTALNPAVGFDPQQFFWSNIMKIAGMVHEVVSFNNYGYVHRVPYFDYINNYAPNIGTFTTQDSSDITSPSYLMGIQDNLTMSVDASSRVSGVVTIGLDPATRNRRITSIPTDSVLGNGWVEKNIGYRKPLVSVNKFYSDPTAQTTISYALLSKSLVPVVNLSFGTHFLPNVYVLNTFNIEEDMYVIGGTLPGVITGIQRQYERTSYGQINMNGHIDAKWLANV